MYMVTGGINYMLFSLKLLKRIWCWHIHVEGSIVIKLTRNTSKAYAHSKQGLILFLLAVELAGSILCYLCVCVFQEDHSVIIFLFSSMFNLLSIRLQNWKNCVYEPYMWMSCIYCTFLDSLKHKLFNLVI